jgi:ribosomal protein S20
LKRYELIKDVSSKDIIVSDETDSENSSFVVINSENEVNKAAQIVLAGALPAANLTETQVAKQNIAAFDVGGEKMCCQPQILNSVLDHISLPAIHAAYDELQIFCSECTPEQLDLFKLAKIIPNTASSCGLITKSDAERLCSKLLVNNAAQIVSAGALPAANLSETRVANRNIAAFDVGGEKRCCLPQILNGVLDHISLSAIHAACDELQIFCSTCTPEQLDVFKLAKIIPKTASSCGLITKSDAERLCSRLLESSSPVFQNVTTGGAEVGQSSSIAQGQLHHELLKTRSNLDTILEAVKCLERDLQFSEDSHKVI